MKLEEVAKKLKECGFSSVRYSGKYNDKLLFEPITKDKTSITGNPQYVAYKQNDFTFLLGEAALQALDYFISQE